jgi:hypothetical protein
MIRKETRRIDEMRHLVREARCFSSLQFFEALLLVHMRRRRRRFVPISHMGRLPEAYPSLSYGKISVGLSQLVTWKASIG